MSFLSVSHQPIAVSIVDEPIALCHCICMVVPMVYKVEEKSFFLCFFVAFLLINSESLDRTKFLPIPLIHRHRLWQNKPNNNVLHPIVVRFDCSVLRHRNYSFLLRFLFGIIAAKFLLSQ